ncbi:MAG: EF-P lysine aminoacylase GenX [Desulfobacterales bacterium]|nr:EF-P lysine aminoacylase GenX [Desulfobacterales bacterium]
MNTPRQRRIYRNLFLRRQAIAAVREFFSLQDFLEVETPVRIPAPAPEAHIEAIGAEGSFLQTSPEIYMKRLLAAGYTRIFQVCKTFRAKERGSRHLPEFTMLEWYAADAAYHDLMTQTEHLVHFVCEQVLGAGHLRYQGDLINLDPPWPRISVEDAFRRHTRTSMQEALADGSFDERMALEIEPALDMRRPAFLYDYPVEKAALARRRPDSPELAERFEAYLGGLEICNGFTELTDPEEQRSRFEAELKRRRQSGLAAYPMPESFLAALSHMPQAAGNALGIDRLVMLIADAPAIDDVTAFVPEEY